MTISQEFNKKLASLLALCKGDWQKGMVSFVDEDLNKIWLLVVQNKKLFTKDELNKIEKALNSLVRVAWARAISDPIVRQNWIDQFFEPPLLIRSEK